MNLSATEVHPRKSTGWSLAPASILRNRLFFSHRSPQTPSLPDADPRSGRPRSAGRKSKFLAVSKARWRKQALDWLKADLAAWSKIIASGLPQSRQSGSRTFQH